MFIAYLATFISWLAFTFIAIVRTEFNIKVARNIISFIHATSVILFFTFGVPANCLFYMTCGYYIMDGLVELVYLVKDKKLTNLPMIVHHIVSCFALSYLRDPVVAKYLYYSFFLMELSNYPIYLVYHLKSNGYDNENVIKGLISVEALGFTVLRLWFGGKILYNATMSNEVPYITLLASAIIYVMSIFWVYGMIQQIMKNPQKQKKT